MMYVVFNIDHIHHLMNEYKMLIFAHNNDQMVYEIRHFNLFPPALVISIH